MTNLIPVNESFAVGSESRESAGNVRIDLHNLLCRRKVTMSKDDKHHLKKR